REESADDAARHRVERQNFPKWILLAGLINQVTNKRKDPKADWKNNQHRMNGMISNTRGSFHCPSSKTPNNHHDDKNDENDSDCSGWVVPPTAAMSPTRNRPDH